MPSWQGKSKGNRSGYRIFVGILKSGGVLSAYILLRFVALYYCFFSFHSTRNLWLFYRKKLGYKRLKSIAQVFRNYCLFGESLIDRVVLMAGIPNRFSFEFEGEENLYRMVEMQQGGLMLSAHIGNWEVAGHLLKRLQTPIHIVMFDGEQEAVKAYLQGVTGERTAHIILIKKDLSHIYEISEAFKKNELVCMHADRYIPGNKTVSAVFLGERASFPAGPFILASRFKVPVCFVFALKESQRHYHFFGGEVKTYVGDKNESLQRMLLDFIGEMEKKVKQYPAQWFNYYNFWEQ